MDGTKILTEEDKKLAEFHQRFALKGISAILSLMMEDRGRRRQKNKCETVTTAKAKARR